MPWNDETLVAGLKKRDGPAVEFAVETYAPRLYRYAVYQLGDTAAAEDLVSEVVTRMLEKIDGYTYTGAPFQAWLFQIARNLVTDSYRQRARAQGVSLEVWLEGGEGYDLGANDTRIESLADQDTLLRVLAQLTDEQRQVITLRLIEGWQPAEIAELLGRSIDSVKSLQYRAIQAMRRCVEQLQADY
jgi:RNA polymerase sigma-70 factor (ECF subfamily)